MIWLTALPFGQASPRSTVSLTVPERDILAKIAPGPKQNPDFYPIVALQHDRLAQRFHPNPSAEIASINDVPLSTTQGWLTKARRLGLLPPGRRGRAG